MIGRRLRWWLAGAIAVATAAPAWSVVAQTIPGPGSRVRVTAPLYDMRGATGVVMRLTTDSITIERDGWPRDVTLPVDRLSRLEVSTGKLRSHGFFRGAGLGLIIGALVGATFGGVQYLSSSDELRGLHIVAGGIVGAGAGLIVGGIVGVARPPDRWENVPLHRQSRRATGIGLSISF